MISVSGFREKDLRISNMHKIIPLKIGVAI